MKKTLFAFGLAALASFTASTAHAGLCATPAYDGTWTLSGTPPNYPASQVSYQLNNLKLSFECVDDSVETCSGNVCSITDGVKEIVTVNVATTDFNFSGSTVNYWGATQMTQGSDGWYYVDTSFEGNPTRVWVQPGSATSLPVVFDVTYLGQHYVHWETFVRPLIFLPPPGHLLGK